MPPPPTGSGFQLTDDPTTPQTSATIPFRSLIPSPSHPRIKGIGHHTASSWCESRKDIPEPGWLINRLDYQNLHSVEGNEGPYKGFSTDGDPNPNIFRYGEDEGAPVHEAVKAVKVLWSKLGKRERKECRMGDVRGDERVRVWSNPELYVNPGGIRLDAPQTSPQTQALIHDILKTSLSPEGYAKALGCTWTNAFLGELVGGKGVLNEHSYNFRLFLPESPKKSGSRSGSGSESGSKLDGKEANGVADDDDALEDLDLLTRPWGWSFFGHHLCLNVVFVGKRMIVGPTFMGAEPDRIDTGPHAGTRLFTQEEIRGLDLMRDLSEENRKKAQVNVDMKEGLGEGRWNPFDERHLGGARQDNRIVPFEGLPISQMTEPQREQVWSILRAFNCYLPAKPLEARMNRLRSVQEETYFAWIGGYGLGDPYYFRIHSPMTFCEFDFHCGIFLTNTSPAKCHIHTINRLPNCEDYGKALIAQWERENAKNGNGE
ncbi:hypothetical protein HD553DRAFT_181223 [Filobasidium floriforme]|uniref:uncharacterized protein n=1 Tax=Filobasidium floriforme TaxID=5210 RepID=UPI001E8D389F|nr:uncharacterized protein HD553DRAFT_181223 [Filobasidium floriforme]KAH8088611.1 hypothetical protein HD553DRAFT_181223 [Filobasidium floriforme]